MNWAKMDGWTIDGAVRLAKHMGVRPVILNLSEFGGDLEGTAVCSFCYGGPNPRAVGATLWVDYIKDTPSGRIPFICNEHAKDLAEALYKNNLLPEQSQVIPGGKYYSPKRRGDE